MSFGFELAFDDSPFSNIFRFQKVVFLGIKLRILMSLSSSSSKRLIMVFIVEKLNGLTSITSVVEGGMTPFMVVVVIVIFTLIGMEVFSVKVGYYD